MSFVMFCVLMVQIALMRHASRWLATVSATLFLALAAYGNWIGTPGVPECRAPESEQG